MRLPAIAHEVPAGHRLVLTVATTDLAYQLPTDARTYAISLAGGAAAVTVPTVDGRVIRAGFPAGWLIAGVDRGAAGDRARRRPGPGGAGASAAIDPDLVDVPVAVTDLVKEYKDGYRAVDGVTFRVERGQVVGLLGPNGAGKTTTLRVLMGLIAPTAGPHPGVRRDDRAGCVRPGPGRGVHRGARLPAAPVRTRQPAALLGRHRPSVRGRRLRDRARDRRPRARRSSAG